MAKKPTAQKLKIVIIGCGNVAWHLAAHFSTLKEYHLTVYNHQPNNLLNHFKKEFNCEIVVGLNKIAEGADLYFITVPDKFIGKVASQLNIVNPGALLLHTSGSVALSIFGNRVHNTGIFYPLQTFSKKDKVTWKDVPILIESGEKDAGKKLKMLAGKFSDTVITVTAKQRLRFHLAAVLVNNFVNSLYVAADDLLNSEVNSLSPQLLFPLISQTTAKLKRMSARDAQTGPAKRKDKAVMEKHLELLSGNKDLAKIYRLLSKLIYKQQSKKSNKSKI